MSWVCISCTGNNLDSKTYCRCCIPKNATQADVMRILFAKSLQEYEDEEVADEDEDEDELTVKCNKFVNALPTDFSTIYNWNEVFKNAPDMHIVYSILQHDMLMYNYSMEFRKKFSNIYDNYRLHIAK